MKYLNKIVFVFAVVLAALYAGSKARVPGFHFDQYLSDNGTTITEDGITVAVIARIELDANTLIEVYTRGTNDANLVNWTLRGSVPYYQIPATFLIQDPYAYDYYIAADYVPPSPVHTNGVWQARGFATPKTGPSILEGAFPQSIIKKE